MTLKNLKNRHYSSPLLAFLITFIAFVGVMIAKGFVPFGDSSMLYSDAYHQYYPFFVAFRKALLSGDSLLYTWSVGMGMDYLGLIAYYLASPLNLLGVLVPESMTLVYFTMLVPIKLALAACFFTLFLKKLYGKDDLVTALFNFSCAFLRLDNARSPASNASFISLLIISTSSVTSSSISSFVIRSTSTFCDSRYS